MSLSTEGFTLLGTLEVPSLGVGVTSSNTPLLIKAVDLTTAMKTSLKADWGDLRLSTDSAGDTQLPLDIVATDLAWTRLTSVAADELIYVWGNKPAAVKEIDAAPFGRNAVWAGARRVYSGSDLRIDRSGNVGDGTFFGTEIKGQDGYGAYTELDASDNRVQAPALGTVTEATILALSTNAGTGGIQHLLSHTDTSARFYFGKDSSGSLRFVAGNPAGVISVGDVNAGLHHTAGVVTAGTIKGFVDGTPLGSPAAYSGNAGSDSDKIDIGSNGLGAQWDGKIYSIHIWDEVKSNDFIDVSSQNQSSATAWWIAEDAAGGGGATLNPTFIPTQELFYQPVVTRLLQSIEPTSISTSEVFYTHTVSPQSTGITPQFIASGESVYTPDVTLLLKFIDVTHIPSEEIFYSPVVSNTLQTIAPLFTLSEEVFFRATVIGGDTIAIPIPDRATWQRVASYLSTLPYQGNNNDIIVQWLIGEGYEDSFNDGFNSYLEDNGYEGSLADKLAEWKKG